MEKEKLLHRLNEINEELKKLDKEEKNIKKILIEKAKKE